MAKYITAQVCPCTSKDKQILIIIIIMITLSPLQFPERCWTTVDRQRDGSAGVIWCRLSRYDSSTYQHANMWNNIRLYFSPMAHNT